MKKNILKRTCWRKYLPALYGLIIIGTMDFGSPAACRASKNHWDFSMGSGVFIENVYDGSDETYQTALPYANVTYDKGQYTASLSLTDGLSVMYRMCENDLMLSIKLNGGGERDSEKYTSLIGSADHSADIKRLLEGTPSVKTNVQSELKLDYISPIGLLGLGLQYHPTTVDGKSDRSYNGFVLAADYAVPIPITRKVAMTAVAGISLMNNDYAEAWFSLKNSTQRLNAFKARGGLKDFQLSLQLQANIYDNFNLQLLAKNVWLQNDARESPFTTSGHQMTCAFFGVYNF